MKRWLATGACVLVAAVLGALVTAALPPRPAAADDAVPPPYTLFLEPGKPYTFSWEHASLSAEVVEVPRGHWVKVKRQEAKGQAAFYWINLDSGIMHIRWDGEQK